MRTRAHHLTRAGTGGRESGWAPGPTGNHAHQGQSLLTESWAPEGWWHASFSVSGSPGVLGTRQGPCRGRTVMKMLSYSVPLDNAGLLTSSEIWLVTEDANKLFWNACRIGPSTGLAYFFCKGPGKKLFKLLLVTWLPFQGLSSASIMKRRSQTPATQPSLAVCPETLLTKQTAALMEPVGPGLLTPDLED